MNIAGAILIVIQSVCILLLGSLAFVVIGAFAGVGYWLVLIPVGIFVLFMIAVFGKRKDTTRGGPKSFPNDEHFL